MKVAEKVKIRFAGMRDLVWCIEKDKLIDEIILKRKITLNELIVAEISGRLVGYLRFEYLWSKVPYICVILVEKEYQRKGVGQAILEFLETYLRKNRYKILLSSSEVNKPSSQTWHRKMGFQECGILAGINEKGIGEVFFRKPLT